MKQILVVLFLCAVTSTRGVAFEGRRFPYEWGLHRGFIDEHDGAGMEEVKELLPKKQPEKKVKKEKKMKKDDTPKVDSTNDFEDAEEAIFQAVERVEKAFVHAVEEEVNSIYHEIPHKEKGSRRKFDLERSEEEATASIQRVEDRIQGAITNSTNNDDVNKCIEDMMNGFQE
uniref:Uncharacterized protein n=1 Tax=Attheya septentrionalis TaxID=420275 RepID=A0A7S2U5W5_9STRA|mmetsp:Transcript_1132/g.2056  ORF Transcript_1132/g.2056 Transcript_1132/m.2056 type:complete len:172 (+) Transcript_1132:155-670(+)|eukprot:CAMPEP_0198285974 /NCGR_PEP_ID=MMETSP1449-20131203/5176_1 /TAXON_ID=420275 /ORGANISM="Attheya septentrionalis, Strain CCMP2084" /LENGTH=171 /DNA_ID=CAMNT_0043983593 /DNA_START=115 /DNA_END=630 /DNA_ORIENTATION=-